LRGVGFSTVGSKSMSIVGRARMVSSGDDGVYSGGYCVPEPSVLAVGLTSWSGEGVRSQVSGGGV
jgi:hypothetical protein